MAAIYHWAELENKGWYCWYRADDNNEFEDWMKTHCPSSNITYRFNSGDPMWTVYIAKEAEAATFLLKWG